MKMSALNSDAPHPDARLTRMSGIWAHKDGSLINDLEGCNAPDAVFWSVPRQMTYGELIALEQEENPQWRPSVRKRFDGRTTLQKFADWGRMLTSRPRDAWLLIWIDRLPPMVTQDYDDSDDWASKRWDRALLRKSVAK